MTIKYDDRGYGYEYDEDGNQGEAVDDGTMLDSFEEFSSAVIGHKIVKVEMDTTVEKAGRHAYYYGRAHRIHLDDGTSVIMRDTSDCCAYTELDQFLMNADKCDNIITRVTHDGDFTEWYVLADMEQVLQLDVNWSPGNPFYYGYGFSISVEKDEELS